jgi:hypothetical protein
MLDVRRYGAWDLLLPILAVVGGGAYLVLQLPAATHKAAVIAVSASYLAFVVWLSTQPRRLRLALFFGQAGALVGLYGAESFAAFRKYETSSLIGQARRLTMSGDPAAPAIPPSTWYFDLHRADIDAGRRPLPLAGLANVTSVLCIEADGWVTFTADRSGFRNPPRPAGEETVDVLLIGDSVAQGTCVKDDATLAADLRRSGLAVLNLGMHGSGPLFELAILKEYGTRPRFKRLVWVFYEGDDIYNLSREAESALLRRYLVAGAIQNLETRQAEIDAAFRAGLAGRDALSWRDIARLKELRAAIGLMGVGPGGDLRPAVAPHLPLLAEVWDRARRIAEDRGAAFTVLYVPAPTRFAKGSGDAIYFADMERLVGTLSCRAGFDFLSLARPIADSGDPLRHYALAGGRHGHFNEAGYRLAAEKLGRRLAGRDQPECPTR